MPAYLTAEEYATVEAACERLVPGAAAAGVADYVDGLLGAFLADPPRIWAGPDPRAAAFVPLGRLDELAWRTRIEGSRGIPEREFNGPVAGLQERYRAGLELLGTDFTALAPDAQDERLRAAEPFTSLLHEHACEGMYAAPAYGGNRDLAGWRAIGYAGDVQPRGWSDAEVSEP